MPGALLPLRACRDAPPGKVGRKARMLAWADESGLSTPGGWVIASDVFWSALEDCGVARRARYLQACMLDLEPAHVLAIADGIAKALLDARLEAFAAPLAAESFERLGAPVVACRSSAAMEDGADAAFPGIFTSRLNIASGDALAGAVAAAWRSAFTPTAMRYILRMKRGEVDLSLALLIQRQVDARIFGLWFGADPSAGRPEPVVELSLSGPEALVGGLPPWARLHRQSGHWMGLGAWDALVPSLIALEAAARQLQAELGSPADIEFALPDAGEHPVILQARPVTRADAVASQRRVAGLAVQPRAAAADDGGSDRERLIAVIEGLDSDSYGLAFRYDGVVVERLVSRLGHFAILCRELGVPMVSGVAEATGRLAGRYVVVDEASNSAEALDRPPALASSPQAPREGGRPQAVMTAIEAVVTLLGGSPEVDRDPLDAALAIARAYGRSLGARDVEIVAAPISPSDLRALDGLGSPLYGASFSAARLMASLPPKTLCARR